MWLVGSHMCINLVVVLTVGAVLNQIVWVGDLHLPNWEDNLVSSVDTYTISGGNNLTKQQSLPCFVNGLFQYYRASVEIEQMVSLPQTSMPNVYVQQKEPVTNTTQTQE